MHDRGAALLDPTKDAVRMRAMYTYPNQIRKGMGPFIMSLCEEAAKPKGFTRLELAATMVRETLYRAYGYVPYESHVDDRGDSGVSILRMKKAL